jgi:uncharacterized protein YybS (DUF2232 family)
MVPQVDQGDLKKEIISGIAATSLIFAVSIYLPVIGFFSSLFIPLPIIFYRSKLGRTNGAIIPLATLIVISVLLGGMSPDMLFFIGLLMLGFAIGEAIAADLSVEKTVLYPCGLVLVTGIVGLIFYTNISGTGIVDLITGYVAKNLEMTMALYENMGMPQENIHMISSSLKNIEYVLVRILPSLAAALCLLVAWISILLARPLLGAKNLFFPDFGALNLWKAPEFLVWGVIGCGLVLIVPQKTLGMLSLNGLILLMTIYFFQGISIVSFYFEKKQLPKRLSFFLYSIMALQQILLLLVIGLGFFDIWLNFRKLKQ